jgi:hypothetical protein
MLIAVMMQRHTVKLLKRIRNLPAWRLQARIKRHTLHLGRRNLPSLILARRHRAVRVAQVYGLGFLDVAEVDRVDATALVGDDGGLGVPEESPGGVAEEGVGFYVGGAGAGAEAAEFVFD